MDHDNLKNQIKIIAKQLGFQSIGFLSAQTTLDYTRYQSMLDKQYHAGMSYLDRNHDLRCDPRNLLPEVKTILSVRMDYLPPNAQCIDTLRDRQRAYIARYALGRDYHRLMRKRLKQLALAIESHVGEFTWRPFVDSAPVLEKPIAQQAGIGWQGKNTLILNKQAGSYFFLGELFTSLEIEPDKPATDHCGSCSACLAVCPTQAITAPYQLDSRLCIAYWTIEHVGTVPIPIREKMGNRVFGCDDCQLICPWNKFAKTASEIAFYPRHQLDSPLLTELFGWSEQTYLDKTIGSAIRRTGYQGWLRNLAIGLGNAPYSPSVVAALTRRHEDRDPVVREHTQWALSRQQSNQTAS